MTELVVLDADSIRALIREELRAILASEPPSRWKWLGTKVGPKRFGLTRDAWLKLIADGVLPAQHRRGPGGKVIPFVRESDAVRALTPKESA